MNNLNINEANEQLKLKLDSMKRSCWSCQKCSNTVKLGNNYLKLNLIFSLEEDDMHSLIGI